MRVVVGLTVLLVSLAWSGCFGGPTEDALQPGGLPDEAPTSHVVVGIVDSGINPYHEQFHDHGSLAWTHPREYIPGYPADTIALRLSLNETDWLTAVASDCDIWNGLQPDVLYWIPGTRIVGLRISQDWVFDEVECTGDALPVKGLDTLAPHGTGAAGRAAGATTSLCPECRIVMSQGAQRTDAMLWMAEQSWIDVQSNSWVGYLCHQLPSSETAGCDRGDDAWAREATEKQVTFAASGNGIRSTIGVSFALGVGMPTYLRPAQGHAGVIVVGGHDNGEVIVWPGSIPHVVADAWNHPSAAWNQTTTDGIFGGTSGATPFAAGVFARLILDARFMLGDNGTGLRDGALAVAGPEAVLPTEGPLADGILTRHEAQTVYMKTAFARPVEEQPYDGTLGCALDSGYICTSRSNDLGPWSVVPEGVPAYYFIGYGQVGVGSLTDAVGVLTGDAGLPSRPLEDKLFEVDSEVRATLQE